jgi:tRNA threonylcarbamoyladenosine modification (KEOPS) complex  Pcc1 subunit
LEAEIVLDYDNAKVAEAVAKAVSPDNFKTPKDLKVETACVGKQVVSRIECSEKLSTLVATIDDLLSCVSTAERTIQATKRLE